MSQHILVSEVCGEKEATDYKQTNEMKIQLLSAKH